MKTATAAAATAHEWSDSALESKQIEQYFKVWFFSKYGIVGYFVRCEHNFSESPNYSLQSYALCLYGFNLFSSYFDIFVMEMNCKLQPWNDGVSWLPLTIMRIARESVFAQNIYKTH